MAAVIIEHEPSRRVAGHAGWVRLSHALLASSILALAVSGFVILMAHPRLYWGQTGNDLTPALIELPISRNYKHGGWTTPIHFFSSPGSALSADRTFDIFNQNAWGRSLHFLSAWLLVLTGCGYFVAGFAGGHLRRDVVPHIPELMPRRLWRDIVAHLHLPMPRAQGGPPYGPLQKLAYAAVVFAALPLMVLTGLTMSPAVTNAYPVLLDAFGGSQSARTVHFFCFLLIVLFLIVHVAMVLLTGFRRQMRAMILGN
jgi:thiosulfate reductase cytochrome b subunit